MEITTILLPRNLSYMPRLVLQIITETTNMVLPSTDGLTIPGFYNLSNSANPIQGNNFVEERRTSSVYAVLDLEFLNAIYLTATGRNDVISTLPTANNSFFYPSVSTSVVVSQLTKLPKWFSYLKARGSWSRVSSATLNDNAYTYSYLPSFNKGTIWNSVPSLTFGDALLNGNLTPQTSDSWEVGVDTKFFNNRLSLEATYYQNKRFQQYCFYSNINYKRLTTVSWLMVMCFNVKD